MVDFGSAQPVYAPPERVHEDMWDVRHNEAALQILDGNVLATWLAGRPGEGFVIRFSYNSSARTELGDALWTALMRLVAAGHTVEVFPLVLRAKYQPWTGQADDLHRFDAIKITAKKA